MQRKANWKNNCDILISDFPTHFIYIIYIYIYNLGKCLGNIMSMLTKNTQCFLNELCKVCMSTNQVFKFQ